MSAETFAALDHEATKRSVARVLDRQADVDRRAAAKLRKQAAEAEVDRLLLRDGWKYECAHGPGCFCGLGERVRVQR